MASSIVRGKLVDETTYLLLLHQFCIRTVVDHIRSKDGRSEAAIYFLGVDVLQLPVQNEFISLNAQIHGYLPAE